MSLKLVSHPLIADRLGYLRDKRTPSGKFREMLHQISLFLFYEANRLGSSIEEKVETPLGWTTRSIFNDRDIVLVPILRAGLGMTELILRVLPNAEVYHIGMYRDERSLKPVKYYSNLSSSLAGKRVYLLDPMIATAGSVLRCYEMVKAYKPAIIITLCVIISPEGAQLLEREASDMEIFAAAMDAGLNERGFIYPGLGDAGDRYYGNKRER